MKKLFILCLLLINGEIKSQTNVYHPFANADAVWYSAYYGNPFLFGCLGTFVDAYTSTYIAGDTIINNAVYHKLYTQSSNLMGGPVTCGPSPCPANTNLWWYNISAPYTGAIREDTATRTVYIMLPDSVNEYILYEFNIGINGKLHAGLLFDTTCTVIHIDSVLVGNGYRKRFEIVNANNVGGPLVIEGIGSQFGLLHCQFPFEQWSELLCYSEGNNILWPNQATGHCTVVGLSPMVQVKEKGIYPNPSHGHCQIHGLVHGSKVQVINMQGCILITLMAEQEVLQFDISHLPQGVYLVKISHENEGKYFTKLIIE